MTMKKFAIFLSIICLADEPTIKVEFRHAQDEAAPGFTQRKIEGTSQSVYVHDTADFTLTPDVVKEAKVSKDAAEMKSMVEITFTQQGGEKLGKLTGDWIEKRLAILVDDKFIAAPIIKTKITGAAVLEGNFTEAEARQIVRSLQGR
jgi:preprotein translocase subunit SecD